MILLNQEFFKIFKFLHTLLFFLLKVESSFLSYDAAPYGLVPFESF